MNKRSTVLFLAALVIFGLNSLVVQAADSAYFTADKTTPFIGEPIQLTLHLRVPQNAQLILPDFAKMLSPFTVENVGSLNRIQQFDDASVEYELPLRVVLWSTGSFQTPPLTIAYQLPDATAINLTVEPLQFVVPSILNDNDLSLRPFKPVVNLPYFPLWIPVPIIAMLFGVAYVIFRKRLSMMQKQAFGIEDTTISGHPDVVYALKLLKQIEQSNDSPLAIYVQVSDCLRRYLSKRYSIQTLDLTTSELVAQLNEKALFTDEYQQKLIEMLRRADLVKFARVIPKQEVAQQYTSVASQWIRSVEQAKFEQHL